MAAKVAATAAGTGWLGLAVSLSGNYLQHDAKQSEAERLNAVIVMQSTQLEGWRKGYMLLATALTEE